jgi:glutamine synthetase
MSSYMIEWMREHRITEVECIVPDMTGVARGKIVPKAQSGWCFDPVAESCRHLLGPARCSKI